MPQEGFLDQYHARDSEISVMKPERPAVPGGVPTAVKASTDESSSLDLSVNLTQRSKKKPSVSYELFDYEQEQIDDSQEFKTRL